MTPIRLKMKNFITYTEEEVDFQKKNLANQVFLITGKTGAGKTTVFDAIMFALYGETSGSARNGNGYESLHCNYAQPTDETCVTFEFELNGKRYVATRKFSYTKTGNLKPLDAELSGDDIEPLTGNKKVTAECTRILGGVSADQFRQVAMLAQGEFRKFMEADSREREKILEVLFNVENCARYTALIEKSYEKLKKEYEKVQLGIRMAVDQMDRPEWIPEEIRCCLTEGDPRLTDALDALCRLDAERMKEADAAYITAQKLYTDAKQHQTAAAENNKKLHTAKDRVAELEKLQARTEEMDRLSEAVELAQNTRALVRKFMDDTLNAQRKLQYDRKQQADKSDALNALLNRKNAAEEAANEAKSRQSEIDDLKGKLTKLNEELPKYKERDDLRLEIADSDAKQSRAAAEKAQLTDAQDRNRVSIEALTAKAEALKNADVELSEARNNREAAAKTAADWMLVVKDVTVAEKEAQKVEAEKEKLLKLNTDYREKKQLAETRENAFLNGQAQTLARELGKENETADAQCPVCRHTWSRGSFVFSADSISVPTEAEVRRLKSERDAAEAAYNGQYTLSAQMESSLRAKRESIAAAAAKLVSECDSWDRLTADGYAQECWKRFRDAEGSAKAAEAEAEKRAADKRTTEAELSAAQKRKDAIAEKLSSAEKALSDANTDIQVATAKLSGIRLSHETKAEADRELAGIQKTVQELSERIERTGKAQKDAEDAYNTALGELAQLKNRIAEAEEELKMLNNGLSEKLAEAGFAGDIDGAKAAMHLENENYVIDGNQTVTRFRSDLKNAEKNAADALENAKGLSYEAPETLQAAVKAAEEGQSKAQEGRDDAKKLMDAHAAVCMTVREAKQKGGRIGGAYERIRSLRTMATSGVSFKRFAMAEDFEAMLTAANTRLMKLSSGRFELVPTDELKSAKASGGLDFKVRDNLADKEESSGSISGGESFEVSMSLALGLSDVVQARAGGTSIDTVFIDEGFGSLDGDTLSKAVEVLEQLSSGSRTVGVISHVSELEEAIGTKVEVRYVERKGSHLVYHI